MAAIPIFNPPIPFMGQIPGGLRPSLMIRLKGTVHPAGRCEINFVNTPAQNSTQDVMFHISIRPNDKVIVRNHYQFGSWGMEERYGPCQVKKNKPFEIVILAELQHYKIAVNGHHLGVFRHRLPLHMVQFINVKGSVHVDHILLEQDMVSAQQQMPILQAAGVPACPGIHVIQNTMPVYMTPYQPQYQQPPPYSSQAPTAPQSMLRIGGLSIEKHSRSLVLRNKQKTKSFTF